MLKGRARKPFQPALLPAKFCKLSEIDKQKRELKERILYNRLNPQKKMCFLMRQKAREPCADENTNIKKAQFICGPKRPHPSVFHCRLSNSPCNYDDIICDVCDLKVPYAVHFCADTISIEGQNELIDTSILDYPDDLLRDPNKPCTCDKATQDARPPPYKNIMFLGSPTCGQICGKPITEEKQSPEVKVSTSQTSPKQVSPKQIPPKGSSSGQVSPDKSSSSRVSPVRSTSKGASKKGAKERKPEKKMVSRISKTKTKGSNKRYALRKPEDKKPKVQKKPSKKESSKASVKSGPGQGPSKKSSSQQKPAKKQRTRSKAVKRISKYDPNKKKFKHSRQKRDKKRITPSVEKALRQTHSSDYYYRQNKNKKK